jgi:hypothetical protein
MQTKFSLQGFDTQGLVRLGREVLKVELIAVLKVGLKVVVRIALVRVVIAAVVSGVGVIVTGIGLTV